MKKGDLDPITASAWHTDLDGPSHFTGTGKSMVVRASKTRIMTKQETAFVQLWQTYRARLRGYVRAYVFNTADVEEILQETSIVLWKKFDEFKPGSSFLAWAIAAARFEILDFRQKGENHRSMFSEQAIEALTICAARRTEQYRGFWEVLNKCVGNMTDRQRDLFHRRFVVSESPSDIAKQMGRPPSTIYSALQRLRRQLAECLSRHLGEEQRP